MLDTNSFLSVDRPDIAKESKACLTFKEVRDSLFKFLMQAGIPFSGHEYLPIYTEHKIHLRKDEKLESKVVKGMKVIEKGKLIKTKYHIVILW